MSLTTESNGTTVWFWKQLTLFLRWLHRTTGIDRAIGFTILARGWGSTAGLVTLALIARFLSPAEQGYYYTFGSLIALQIVFELGFSFVILQMASHERAHLTISPDGVISGDPASHSRLASVLQKAIKWYSSAAAFLLSILVFAGFYFFSAHKQNGTDIHWQWPWLADAVAATCTFLLDPVLSFMEGCGFVARVARLRFVQAAVGSIFAWSALIAHHGLFAPAATIAGYAIVSATWLFGHRRLLYSLWRRDPEHNRIGWMKEVWPFQWRIAVSWLCGYFIFQLYNPVLFAYRGAVAAGQMGMSLSLANALGSIAVSWINTKAAPFGAMIARREYVQLDQLFFKALRQSFAVCLIGCLTLWVGVFYLNMIHSRLANRVLDPISLGMLLAITALNIIIAAEALYLRAHKQEKLLVPSVLGALLIAISTYSFGPRYGALGVVAGSLCVSLMVGIPMATYAFLKYRRLWHSQ